MKTTLPPDPPFAGRLTAISQRLKARDPQAMAELYDIYSRMVFRMIKRAVGDESISEDLTQETFLRVWNGINGFDEKRGVLGAWIAAVARNTAIDYLRSPGARNARSTVELKDLETFSSGTRRHWTHEDCVLNFDRVRILHGALEKLTVSQRAVLKLSFVEGMSHAEIARSLDRPLGTVKTWVRTALRILSAQLNEATSC